MKKRTATGSPSQQPPMQQSSLPQHFRRVKPRLAAKASPDGRPANAGGCTASAPLVAWLPLGRSILQPLLLGQHDTSSHLQEAGSDPSSSSPVVFRPQRRQAAAASSDGGLSVSLSTGAFEFPAGSSEAVASPRAVLLSTQAAAEEQAVEDTAAAGASCGTSSDASRGGAAGAQEQECSTCTASLAEWLWLPGRGCQGAAAAGDSDCEDDAVSRGCELAAAGATPAGGAAAGATAPTADADDADDEEEEEEALQRQAAWLLQRLEDALRSGACGEPDVSWLEPEDGGPDGVE